MPIPRASIDETVVSAARRYRSLLRPSGVPVSKGRRRRIDGNRRAGAPRATSRAIARARNVSLRGGDATSSGGGISGEVDATAENRPFPRRLLSSVPHDDAEPLWGQGDKRTQR